MTEGTYNTKKLNIKKNQICKACSTQFKPCSQSPEQMLFCLLDTTEYNMRSGKYGLSASNNNGNSNNISKDINGVFIDGIPVSVADIKRLFVNRYDCYSLQDKQAPEKFPDVKETLTDDIILQSLFGLITIGVRPINPNDGKIKWISWDIDDKENDDSKKVVDTIIVCLKKRGLTGYIEASGSSNSYHVWIFIEPIDNDIAFKFDEDFKNEVGTILSEKGIQNVYIDRGVHKGEKLGSGMIKLPFNIQRKNGKRSKFLKYKDVSNDISKIQPQKLVI